MTSQYGHLVISSGKADMNRVMEQINALPDGVYTIRISPFRRQRSIRQNEYLWGVVYPAMLYGLLDAGWEFTSTEQVHEFFKAQIGGDKVVNRDTGEIIELPKSTAQMSTVQFSSYIEQLRQYANEYLNIEIPPPQ